MIHIPLRYRGIKNFHDWRPGKEHKGKVSVEANENQAKFINLHGFFQE